MCTWTFFRYRVPYMVPWNRVSIHHPLGCFIGTLRKVLVGEYPINDMSININWRPIDPVTEAGRLVLAVPQLAALAIIASWCQNWDGKVGRENQEMFEIRLVGWLDFFP